MTNKASSIQEKRADMQNSTISPRINQYNVVWQSQSSDSSGSMPVGGGDMGLNVWVENNEILFYVARAGCRDENGALLKLGRVRVSLNPSPFTAQGFFRQELKLQEGAVEIQAGFDQTPTCLIRVWTEIHRPVAHIDIDSEYDISASATYETWRYEDVILPQGDEGKHGPRGMCMVNFDQYPGEVRLRQDGIESGDDGVIFYHRNESDNAFDFQHLFQHPHQAFARPLYHSQQGKFPKT